MSNNGCVVKTVKYVGKASHAGGAPWNGVNALYATPIGLMAINSIRETFRDTDTIRVHPIITHGGSQVNVIPGEVRIETCVRGRSRPTRRSIARSGRGRSRSVPTSRSRRSPATMTCDARMADYFKANATRLVGAQHYRQIEHRAGSTDMDDLSQVMPVLHPYIGARGSGHGADFQIVDNPLAYVTPAKALAMMVIDMLADGAAGARSVLKQAKPPMTREQFFTFQRGIAKREVYEGQ